MDVHARQHRGSRRAHTRHILHRGQPLAWKNFGHRQIYSPARLHPVSSRAAKANSERVVVNPTYYDEHRPRHRRCVQFYRLTLAVGAVPLLLALWLGTAYYPRIGPGIYANAGLSLAGLLLLWSVREMQFYPPTSRWGRWIAQHMDDLFPALLIGLQGGFIVLAALLIWNTLPDLGFSPGRMSSIALFGILLLSPVRRILAGTAPAAPSAPRELITESLGYLSAIFATLFIAGFLTQLVPPPEDPESEPFPMGTIIIWVLATLAVLTCVILFIDHVVRKMPPARRDDKIDTLD
jgi:hypothetical protein